MNKSKDIEFLRKSKKEQIDNYLSYYLIAQLNQTINGGLRKLAIKKPRAPEYARLEVCRFFKLGNYACTTAMNKNFRQLLMQINNQYKDPLKTADWLATLIKKNKIFSQVNVAKPGYVNFCIKLPILYRMLLQALKEGSFYGKQALKSKQKILLEFVSANPTGPLNIVSARAAAIGDCLANMFRAVGYNVEREFYINDCGNQIRLLGLSFLLRRLEKSGVHLLISQTDIQEQNNSNCVLFPKEGYQGDYLIKELNNILRTKKFMRSPTSGSLIEKIEACDRHRAVDKQSPKHIAGEDLYPKELCDEVGKCVADYFHEQQRKDLLNFNVDFDNFVYESSLDSDKKTPLLLKKMSPYIQKIDDKIMFLSTAYGDDKDRVLVRRDSRPTYFFTDLVYHYGKTQRGFNILIDILGPDHHGYVARISAGLKALGYSGIFLPLFAQQINFTDKNQVIKMSKRSGKFITLRELYERIPIDVLRYFFIDRSNNAHMDFNFQEAADTTDNNPYYYIAYAHVRFCSILEKAKINLASILFVESKTKLSIDKIALLDKTQYQIKCSEESLLKIFENEERRKLLFFVSRYSEELYEACLQLEPHRFLKFLYQFANVSAQFYTRPENRVLEKSGDERHVLLQLISATVLCLNNGLTILGMQAPKKL